MHLRMCTWSSGGHGFYDISVNYLCYFCGLLTLFVQKKVEPQFMACVSRGGLVVPPGV
jgi:hypothetical protein